MQIASTSQTQADSGASALTSPSTTPAKALGNEQMFLQLLVAQIKNQNPLNPTDGTQFMSQLAQFSSLEQLISLNTTVGDIGTTLGVSDEGTQATDSGSSSS